MILVIAEKPSVAQSIAKVLGAASRWDVLQTRLTIKKITKKQVQKSRICTKKASSRHHSQKNLQIRTTRAGNPYSRYLKKSICMG